MNKRKREKMTKFFVYLILIVFGLGTILSMVMI